MRRVIRITRVLVVLFVMFAALTIVVGSIGVTRSYADFDEPISTEFEKRDVMTDLESIDGFSLLNYPYDSTGKFKQPEIINVVEYCYSPRVNMRGNYGVYVYFYNPQSINISTETGANKITLGIAWDYSDPENVTVTRYEKFDLQICSRSEGNYRDLFYKFKIVDRKSTSDGKTIAERVNSNERRYDVSEIELRAYGDRTPTAYLVGATSKYSGYAKGYGTDEDAESTLSCNVVPLTTLQLEVKSTLWRSESSAVGKNYRSQINSVYFAVPDEYFDNYGRLQKIHASWYEYKTNLIYLCTDPATAKSHANHDEGFGKKNGTWGIQVDSIKDYVSPNTLLDYIYTHSHNSSDIEYMNAGSKQIPACLFSSWGYSNAEENALNFGRTWGYNDVTIDAGDTYDLLSYNENHGFWDKVGDFGFWKTLLGKVPNDESISGIEPIHIVTDEDLSGSMSSLYVSDYDGDDFRAFCNNAENKKVVLFRFATTDYYSSNEDVTGNESNRVTACATSMFFDFDIIDLTFQNGEITTVVPVASSPIDIVGFLEPPKDYDENGNGTLEKILGIILSVLMLIVFILIASKTGILPYIIQGVVWLVTLPFKAIASLFKRKKDKKTDPPVNVTVNLDGKATASDVATKDITKDGEHE